MHIRIKHAFLSCSSAIYYVSGSHCHCSWRAVFTSFRLLLIFVKRDPVARLVYKKYSQGLSKNAMNSKKGNFRGCQIGYRHTVFWWWCIILYAAACVTSYMNDDSHRFLCQHPIRMAIAYAACVNIPYGWWQPTLLLSPFHTIGDSYTLPASWSNAEGTSLRCLRHLSLQIRIAYAVFFHCHTQRVRVSAACVTHT